MGHYSIKELEQLSGIKAHTIRIWEQRYQLLEPRRTGTNIRYYDDEQLKFILNVAMLCKHGHKISHISQWDNNCFTDQVKAIYARSSAHAVEQDLELDANDMMISMIDMDAQKFHTIYAHVTHKLGLEETFKKLIYPFLEKVGILWSIGQINPAQEHFMSSLIRQKIIAAIDQLDEPESGNKFLLLLPPGEHHEMGLLLAYYLLKKNGQRVYYLGQDLPEKEFKGAVEVTNPHFVLTFIVDPAVSNNASHVIKQLLQVTGPAQLLVATRKLENPDFKSVSNLHLLHSIDDLARFY